MTHSGSLQRGSLSLGTFSLDYETRGEGDALVAVHGFGTDREVLRGLAQSLGEDGYRVVLLDLRGHGASGVPEVGDDAAAYGYPAQCGDLLALLDALQIERAHWLGHSMGGQLALMAALREPERARSLVAIGAGPNRPIVDPREQRAWLRAAERFETLPPGELAAALAAAAPRKDGHVAEPAGDASSLYARARGGELARIVRGAFLPMRDNAVACRSLASPALVLVGEQDSQWLEPSRRLAELLPRARLHVVPEAGHLVHLEKHDVVAGRIRDFLRALPD